DALVGFVDANGTGAGNVDGRWSSLTARNQGTVVAPRLTTLQGVALALDGTGTLSTASIRSFISGRLTVSATGYDLTGLRDATSSQINVNGVALDLHNLIALRYVTLTLSGGGTADVRNVIDVDGASFFVSGGVTLAFPAVATYNQASTDNFQTRTFHAEGAGSKLDLSHLTNLTNGLN